MRYLMRCTVCYRESVIGIPIDQHEYVIKPGWSCTTDENSCAGRMKQVIEAPNMIINRSPFPHSGNEIALPTQHHEDIKFKDKVHAREYLAENGLTSKWIENDM